jgi:hypothetical protein
MRPCALPIDDDDAGERDSWRDFIFYVAVDAPVDDVGGTFRAPAAIMEALSTHLPLMITASGDCDDYYEQRYAAEAAVANREHKRQWGAGNIRRHVHLLGDADEGLAEIVASHENDHLLEPDPDPQNSYTWDYWIHATTPKGEKRLGMSWAPDFMSRYYLIHSIMDGDAGVGFTHLEIRLREAGMDTVLFSGPIW